jgi:restriction endonuclease S subunit
MKQKEFRLGDNDYFEILSSGIEDFEGKKDYLSTESIKGTKIKKIECEITQEDRPSRANMQPLLNSIWFAKMQSTLKVYCFDENNLEEQKRYIFSTGFAGIKVQDKIYPRYLKLIFGSDFFNKEKDKLCTGSTQRGINNSFIAKMKISLPVLPDGTPDLEKQKQIVAILEKAEGLKDKRKGLDELFDEYLKSVFYEMFSGFRPESFNQEMIKIIDGDRGVNYPNGNDFSEKGYCLFLNTGNVRKNGFKFDKVMFITKEKDEQLRKGRSQINDVILTTRGTVGNVALYSKKIPYDNIRINSGMVILRPDVEKIMPKFLEYLIQMPLIQDQFIRMNSGSAQPQLPITNLKKIKFLIPPFPLQEKFASIVELVERIKDKLKDEKKDAEELFNALMQKAFSGELI